MLALIRDELHNSEIAIRLGVSVNTVRFHVSNLLAKSGCSDRVALRNWRPQPPSAPPRRRAAVALLLSKPLSIGAGVAVIVSAIVAVSLLLVPVPGRGEDSAPTAADSAASFPGAVVGTLTRQSGGLVVTEPGGSQFNLTSEMTFGRLVGSQVFIVGEVHGDSLRPLGGSPIGPNSRCAGVLATANGIVSVGGSCRGMELRGVPVERLLALRSEKVTVTILACTESRGGRIENPAIDAFGQEQPHACPAARKAE